ncbi:hypothetical protein KC19_5G148600 [Ceratodon purpureus]|uniref:Homoserine dehydrogenase n=2 Tax=Ceratodon purpureus TaxID=3225 RepID=A0A8T0I308_CERPU|nr:hypothetical protein KC19_5G148600 [Ceratodon purpureus]KAG0577335.1 hypothetical protein KC19_5G148600 [Ceratodon purpureus]KAG0577336.1 hypothetical protein KC19_5G148600 [Ceratodon purpureus]
MAGVDSGAVQVNVPLSVGLIGPGLIGKALLNQFIDQVATLKKEFQIDLRVMGIMDSKKMYRDHLGLDLSKWKELLDTHGVSADISKFTAHFEGQDFPNAVIIDCTANAEVSQMYYEWISKGIHIVTPNKKTNSGPFDQYKRVRELQRKSHIHYFYEATVGAGLPIISTLRSLVETGDKIVKVEGVFSGTLSYIFNSFNGEKPFSQIVTEAKAAGYTEPDPRDDLSGMDVARKVVILARECGLQLELDDIKIQSLVPKPLQGLNSAEDFLKELPNFDEEMESQRKDAEASGEVLRYVGVVDVKANEGRVELQRFPKSNAFAQLSGSDNLIAFTTSRYLRQPLIVRGPGAGAEVTAAGVFSDLLRVASYLGAPS